MSRRRLALALLVLAAAGLLVLIAYRNRETQTPEQLALRAAMSRPQWANYDEDVKAQVGATPVAEWEGSPIQARREGPQIHLTFRVTGPWAHRAIALPILLRHPMGGFQRSDTARVEGPRVTYTFDLPQESRDAPLPWIEIKYPRHQRRLTLSEAGTWQAQE